MSRTLWVILILVVVFLLMQLYRPAVSNPPVDPAKTIQVHVQVPPQVDSILRRSCYDCHSNETRYPFYSHVAPSSWLLASDINEGRGEVNFSNWAAYDPARAAKKLGSIAREVQGGDMPPWYYLPMHSDARLSDADKQTIVAWAKAQQAKVGAGAPASAAPPGKDGDREND